MLAKRGSTEASRRCVGSEDDPASKRQFSSLKRRNCKLRCNKRSGRKGRRGTYRCITTGDCQCPAVYDHSMLRQRSPRYRLTLFEVFTVATTMPVFSSLPANFDFTFVCVSASQCTAGQVAVRRRDQLRAALRGAIDGELGESLPTPSGEFEWRKLTNK